MGVWELVSGVLKLLDANELKEDTVQGWRGLLAFGSMEVLSGIASLLKPVEDFIGMRVVVAIVLSIQGFGYIFKAHLYPYLIGAADNRKEANT